MSSPDDQVCGRLEGRGLAHILLSHTGLLMALNIGL